MPTQTVVTMLFLGNFPDLDPDESNTASENSSAVVGTYSSPQFVSVTENDENDDGRIDDDENFQPGTPDTLSYDVGGGTVALRLDSTIAYSANILLGDGSTITRTVGVLQTTSGDVFVRDAGNGLDNLNIQSIELASVIQDDYGASNTGNSIENSQLVCLLEGTLIDTPSGQCAIENLRAGDKVSTDDGRTVEVIHVLEQVCPPGKGAGPIRIPKDALAPGTPSRALLLSPCHRVVVRSPIVRRMFGNSEVFVPAKRLLDIPGVKREGSSAPRRYFNLLCTKHVVLRAENTPVESLFPARTFCAVFLHQTGPPVFALFLNMATRRVSAI